MAAKALGKSLSDDDEVRTKIDSFMQEYYWAARRDNNMRMNGFTTHEGKPAVRLIVDSADISSHYIVTHEQDAQQKDHFYMHLIDDSKEIFKSREMPHDREDAYSFLRGAAKEFYDYEYEKHSESQDQNLDEEQSFHRGR